MTIAMLTYTQLITSTLFSLKWEIWNKSTKYLSWMYQAKTILMKC